MDTASNSATKEEALFFINPSTTNTCITNDGFLIDVSPGKLIGLWDPSSGKCLKIFSNIITSFYYKLNYLSSIDKIIISDEKSLKLFDYHLEKILKVIPINIFLDEIIDHFDPNKLMGINSGMLYLWDMETGQLIKKLNTGSKSRSGIRLENGNYLIRNNEGDIYSIKGDLSSYELINTQGAVYSFCQIKNTEFALGRNQSIHIMEAEKNSIFSILKGFDEIYISLLHLGNGRILSGSNKATLRIWEMKSAKCFKTFGIKEDLKYLELFLINGSNRILSSNNETKKMRVWDLGNLEEIEDQPQSIKLIEGEVSNIQKIVRLDEENISLLCFAQYFDGQSVFLQEIRIFNLKTNTFTKKKPIHRSLFMVEATSMMSVYDGKLLMYLAKSVVADKDILHLWDYAADQDIPYDFQVEKNPNVFFYSFERVVITYCLTAVYTPPLPPNLVSNNPTYRSFNVKGPSGITIYDFSIRPLWKLEFDCDYLCNAIEMIDQNTLIFINSRNQMEWWNIRDKKILKKIECNPNVFNFIKSSNKILFMTNNNSEIVLWDAETLGCLQKKKKNANRNILKIETISEFEVLILYNDGVLEKWNIRKGDIKNCKISQIKDFFIEKKQVFLLGEVLIQSAEIIKIF